VIKTIPASLLKAPLPDDLSFIKDISTYVIRLQQDNKITVDQLGQDDKDVHQTRQPSPRMTPAHQGDRTSLSQLTAFSE